MRNMMKNKVLILVVLALFASPAWAIKVKEEIVIHETCFDIWPMIKNFATPHKWHPAFVSTEAQGGNEVGATRVISLGNGAKLYERLTRYSSKAMTMNYVITKVSPPDAVPVENYQSRFRLEREGSRCEVDWSSTFDNGSSSMSDAELKSAIEGVYRAGLENIMKMVMRK